MATYASAHIARDSFDPYSHRSEANGFSSATRLLFYVGYYALNGWFTANLFSIILTMPTFAICCFNISRIKANYATVQDVIWFVVYLYFVIAPCQTLRLGYIENDGPVSGLYFDNAEIITAGLIVFLFVLVSSITTTLFAKDHRGGEGTIEENYGLKDRMFPMIVLVNLFACFMFVMLMGGLGNVLADRLTRDTPADVAPVAIAFLALQAVTCLFACVYVKCKPRQPIVAKLLVGCFFSLIIAALLVSQNPFNAARFLLIETWFPVVLIFCSGKIKVLMFYCCAIVGLLVLMPVLNFTGRFGMSISQAAEHVDISEFIFKIPYLDVFDMLVYEVRYLHSEGFYWGGKTLSVMLFFIPREIWTGKETLIAKDMGAELVEMGTAGTDNLSLFFGGEFYADLGLLGVVAGAFIVALLLTVFGSNRPVRINGMDMRSFIFMAAVPILIRGPLAAVLPLFFLEMVALAILTRVLCERIDPIHEYGVS